MGTAEPETSRGPPLDRALYSSLIRLASDPKNRFVVALGGGSVPALCGNLALLGILEELDLRPRISEVWGTSAGAATGGPFASGTAVEPLVAHIAALDRRRAVDYAWGTILFGFVRRLFGGSLAPGLIHGKQFSNTVEAALAVADFESCPTPFRCIACADDENVRRKVFRRGPLLPAIFASMSVPGIFIPAPPPPGETSSFLDGGMVEKTPILSPINEHARLAPDRHLFLLCTHFSNEARRRVRANFVRRFLRTIHTLEDQVWEYQLTEARARTDTTLLVLNPHLEDKEMFNFANVPLHYATARERFSDQLQNGRILAGLGAL